MAKLGDINLGLSWKELVSIIIASLFIGFGISYNDWGFGAQFVLSIGIINLLIAAVICAITFWLRTNFQKRAGRIELATVEFTHSWTNLFYTFILTLLTGGLFIFASPGRPSIRSITHLRPGFEKPHLSPYDTAKIVAAGTVVSLLLIVVAKIWMASGGGLLASYLLRTNIWIALISLIPLPVEGLSLMYQHAPITRTIHTAYPALAKAVSTVTPVFEGEWVFFGSRPMWFLLITAAVSLAILIQTPLPATTSLLVSAAVAVIAAGYWIYKIEFGGQPK